MANHCNEWNMQGCLVDETLEEEDNVVLDASKLKMINGDSLREFVDCLPFVELTKNSGVKVESDTYAEVKLKNAELIQESQENKKRIDELSQPGFWSKAGKGFLNTLQGKGIVEDERRMHERDGYFMRAHSEW